MRAIAAAVAILALTVPLRSSNKLTFDERVELMRGLMAEYVTVKQPLPRSKKPLPFAADGTFDKRKWEAATAEFGPAARLGDLVQFTKVTIEEEKILLEINGGLKSGRKWYDGIELGMGGRNNNPVSQREITAKTGTTIEVTFGKPIAGIKSGRRQKNSFAAVRIRAPDGDRVICAVASAGGAEGHRGKARHGGHGPGDGGAGSGRSALQAA